MALLHRATLNPSKLDLLSGWLPSRPWFRGSGPVQQAGAYRFDDPAGEVGIETFLLTTTAGPVLQVPLTYRAGPLPGAEDHLVGTLEHSVLGRRWVYDGCADPVWAAQLATVILTGGTEVPLVVETGDGRQEQLEPSATVAGSGTAGTPVPPITAVTSHDTADSSVVTAGAVELVVARVVGTDLPAELTGHTLTGRWDGGGPAVLAAVRTG